MDREVHIEQRRVEQARYGWIDNQIDTYCGQIDTVDRQILRTDRYCVYIYTADRQTDKHTDRQTDRKTHRPIQRYVGRQVNR